MEENEKLFCANLTESCLSCDYLDAVYFDGDIVLRCFKKNKLLRWWFSCDCEEDE